MNPYASPYSSAEEEISERALFMRRVYGHLAMALLLFVALETFLLSFDGLRAASVQLLQGRWIWFLVLLAFMGVTAFANRLASSSPALSTQYTGLGIYIVAEALIFLPLFSIVLGNEMGLALIAKAGLITGGLFLGLSVVALTTHRDLNFMGRFLKIGFCVALGIIVASCIFGMSLGIWFIAAMVLLIAGSILYQTQQIYQTWPAQLYVAASLQLFAAFVTLLWYIVQFLMSFSSRD